MLINTTPKTGRKRCRGAQICIEIRPHPVCARPLRSLRKWPSLGGLLFHSRSRKREEQFAFRKLLVDEHGKGQARRAPLSGPGPVQGPDVTTLQRRPWKQPPSQPAGEVPAPDRPAPRAHPHEDHYSPALPEQRAEQHPPPGGVQHRQVGHGGGQGLPALGAARVWDCGWGGAAADLPRDRDHGWGGHRALHPRALGSRGWGSESLVGRVATQAGRKERAVLAGRGTRWGGAHGGAGRTARSCLRCRPAVAPGESEARGVDPGRTCCLPG